MHIAFNEKVEKLHFWSGNQTFRKGLQDDPCGNDDVDEYKSILSHLDIFQMLQKRSLLNAVENQINNVSLFSYSRHLLLPQISTNEFFFLIFNVVLFYSPESSIKCAV